MEQWELDFNWLKIQHFIKDALKTEELPGLETVLFLLGLQELGIVETNIDKKRKVEITTVGMYMILSHAGYFRKTGVDKDGWPVWKEVKPFEPKNEQEENSILKKLIIRYFEEKYNL